MTTNSRREFLGALGAGAAVVAARPLFAASRAEAAQSGEVLLNFNESPYGPSPRALTAIRAATQASITRYHPEDHYDALRAALASHHGVTPAHIRIGAGSTEFLKTCNDAFVRIERIAMGPPAAPVVVADPAYEAVLQYAANYDAGATKVALTPDHRHDLDRMARAVLPSTGLVYICNPNNPTGTINRKDEIAQFMSRIPDSVPVLVDEAYAEFVNDSGYESAVKYVKEGRNVIIAKTFSKIHGLAGMRIGYAIANPEIIARLTPLTVDFAVTGVAASGALASMRDPAFTAEVARKNAVERTRFVGEMTKMGLRCMESHANFVMVDIKRPVAPVIQAMAAKRVKVGREFSALPTFLRVTLGTSAEMDAFYPAFRAVLA
jgi:histidinol-phosphate aminotransferase